MSEIEIFIELLDEKSLNFILSEFFSDNNPKQNESIKKIKLQKLLREPNTNKMKKKYRGKGESCLHVLKRCLADEELLNCDIENFVSLIISKQKSNLSNLELFCTASIKFPNITQENINTIVQNNREKEFLFKEIEEFKLSSSSLDSIELKKLQKDIEDLREEIAKIKYESEQVKEENNRLSIQKSELANENKKFKKSIKKNEREILNIKEENIELIKINEIKINEIIKKDSDINKLKEEYETLIKEKREVNSEYEKLKSKKYIEIDSNIKYTEYTSCLIYTSEILAVRSLFKEILFISYEEYLSDYKAFINKLNELGIKDVYIVSNNISMRDIGVLKRRIRKEKMDYRTLLFSSELNLVKDLLENTFEESDYVFI